ncbi:oligosaccharide flippase family protein [Rhizobium sp. BG4]|uniref:oligosaccharide flippase family protein n=1 Tax=Rhizobium sp. BG4 TaxID=2613770 RepID=UPI00193DEBBF|nr:oligosaccharide flippase family protein [Rhizobium sp. BG4]
MNKTGRFIYRRFTRDTVKVQTHFTHFMRNPPLLDALTQLTGRMETGEPLRIASIGCSTGAELYSVLYTLRKAYPGKEIFGYGSDLSEEVVKVAQLGRYQPGRAAGEGGMFHAGRPEVEASEVAEFSGLMEPGRDGVCEVHDWLKAGTSWFVADAIKDDIVAMIGPQDVVLANNFMGPMDDRSADQCLRNVMGLVRPGGILVIDGVDLDVKTRTIRGSRFTRCLSIRTRFGLQTSQSRAGRGCGGPLSQLTGASQTGGCVTPSFFSVHIDNRAAASIKPPLPTEVNDMLRHGVWLLGAKIGSQAIQFLLFFMAARFLEASEFGLYAVLSAVMTLLTIIAEAGWAEHLLRTGYSRSLFQIVTSLSVGSAGLCSVISLALAGFVAALAGPAAGTLLAVYSLVILPTTVATSFEAALISQGHLKAQATVRLVSEFAGLAIAAGGMATELGVVSLPLGRFMSQIVAIGLYFYHLRERPSLRPTVRDARELADFSFNIVVNRLIIFAGSFCSTFAVAGFQSVTDAAYYRAAERIVAAFSEALGEPTRALSWIMFRRGYAEGKGTLREFVATAWVALYAVSFPIFFVLLLFSGEIVDKLLGERWHASALIVSILAVKQLLLLPGYFNEPLLSVTGTIAKRLKITIRNVALLVGATFAFAPLGPVMLAIAQCGVAAYGLWSTVGLQHDSGGLEAKSTARALLHRVVPAVFCMAAAFIWRSEALPQSLQPSLNPVLDIAFVVLVYSVALALAHAVYRLRQNKPNVTASRRPDQQIGRVS